MWNSGDTTTVPNSENEIVSSDLSTLDLFGYSIAIHSTRVVVGVTGDDDNGSASGSAYIFDLNGSQLHKLTASDGVANDSFGWSVAIGNGIIAVGAPFTSSGGAVYLYDFSGTEVVKISGDDTAASDSFGYSIAINDDKVFVGARGHNSSAGAVYAFNLTGTQLFKIDRASSLELGTSIAAKNKKIVIGTSGGDSVFLYSTDGIFIRTITSFDYASNDAYGYSVSISDGRIVVGAPQDDDNSLASSGSAYIYDYEGSLVKKITSSAPEQAAFYGSCVSIGSGRIVVGAYGDDSEKGSIYIYDLDGTLLQRVQGSTSSAGNQFGRFLCVNNGRIASSGVVKNTSSGSVFLYNTPLVYNLYNSLDMENY
jgi:tricorn protease-like protein